MQTRKLGLENLQHLLAIQLLVICTVETLVHFFMPFVIPDSRNLYQGIAEALLLSAVTAPFVWATVARPLRRSSSTARLPSSLPLYGHSTTFGSSDRTSWPPSSSM